MQQRRRIGIMGGTFDPIHHGHLVAASEVQSRFQLDEVVFVPTGQPWQKGAVSPAEDRYLMTVIATASNPRFQVSRADVDRDGPTYTVDTLRDLSAIFGPSVSSVGGTVTVATVGYGDRYPVTSAGRIVGGMTMLLGIAGALVGGFIGRAMGFYGPNESAGWLMSILGAVILLLLYRVATRRRA